MNPRTSSGLFFPEQAPGNETNAFANSDTAPKPLVRRSPHRGEGGFKNKELGVGRRGWGIGMKEHPAYALLPTPDTPTQKLHPHASAPEPEPKPAPASVGFPSFDHAVSPVNRIPNWGAMTSPEEWEQTYRAMDRATFVSIPRYDLSTLTVPMLTLLKHREENTAAITAKLYYSTRHFAAYDLDAEEFSGVHPGIDLKLALGTPVGAVGGGRVHRVTRDENLGLHVMIEHQIPDVGIFFSIYGHLGESWVSEGDDVTPGKTIGTVGMSGRTTAPHLHLQIDRDTGARPHVRYWPNGMPSPAEAEQFTVHPMRFIGMY